jgi:peptidyl-prolyl cis-trans isomerase SurA
MKKVSTLLAAVLVLAAALALRADSVVEEIIARVNDDIITRGDYARNREQALTELKQADAATAQQKLSEREKDILRDMIDQQLLLQKGKELGITADTELIKRLDDIRKQMKLETIEDVEKVAQEQGVSFEDFKQNTRNGIITQQVISREVGGKIKISDDEVNRFYDLNKAQFEGPEQVQIAEVLIAFPKDDKGATKEDPASEALTQKKAEDVLADVKKGTKFSDAAKKYSDGPTAQDGGDLGLFKRGMLAKNLEELTFDKMKNGDVSDVIRTKQGFIILKLILHQSSGTPPVKEVEPQIQEAIYLQKLQPALRDYLTKLREESYIDVKPGYADSGASPNQTKPIITAEKSDKEPVKKKKKKFLVF